MTSAGNTHQARNPALDTVRALAIAFVFAAHSLVPLTPRTPSLHPWTTTLGAYGVDQFFALSGYLIGTIALREYFETGSMRLWAFWRRRWFRTLPAYYAALGLYALKDLAPGTSGPGLGNPYSYLVFAQTYALGHLTDFAHSWSLCVEEHFYLVLPCLLFVVGSIPVLRKHTIALLVTISIGLFVLRTALLLDGVDVYQKQSHWRTDGLLMGVIIAALEQRGSRLLDFCRAKIGVASWLALGATFTAIALHVQGSIHWQAASAIACGATVVLAAHRHPVLTRLGNIAVVAWLARVSYSFYLLHPLVLSTLTFGYFGRHFHQVGATLGYFVLAFVLSSIVADASYRLVEKVFLRIRDLNGREGVRAATLMTWLH